MITCMDWHNYAKQNMPTATNYTIESIYNNKDGDNMSHSDYRITMNTTIHHVHLRWVLLCKGMCDKWHFRKHTRFRLTRFVLTFSTYWQCSHYDRLLAVPRLKPQKPSYLFEININKTWWPFPPLSHSSATECFIQHATLTIKMIWQFRKHR